MAPLSVRATRQEVTSEACDLVLAANHPSPEDGGPCVTCAFRPDTEANRTPHTWTLARLCVEGAREFRCHEKPQLCRGFVAAINVRGLPETEDEARWVQVSGMAADILQRAIEAGIMAERAAAKSEPSR